MKHHFPYGLKLLRHSGLAAILFLVSVSSAKAGIDEGIVAYNTGDHATAYSEFLPVAESGNKKAQLLLGLMYDNGLGIKRNYEQAAYWYARSAEQGQPRAQFNLGLMYESGEGINADREMAFSWVQKSAEQGYTEAQDKLGHFYETGENTEVDLVQSHLWYSLAADTGVKQSIVSRDRIAANLTESQLRASQDLFQTWKNVFQSVF